jgi:hypothetical protein
MNKDFDQILINEGIKFLPYIGDNYLNNNPKILILGESHYTNEDLSQKMYLLDEYDNDKNATRDVVENYTSIALKNMAAILTNRVIDNDYIWDYISFYNFFQKYVGFSSSDKSLIDESLIEKSQIAFLKIIKILSPDLVIAWGISDMYWEWLPQENYKYIDEKNKLFNYNEYPKSIIWSIHHPSSQSFNLYDWTYKFKELICNKYNYRYPIKQCRMINSSILRSIFRRLPEKRSGKTAKFHS